MRITSLSDLSGPVRPSGEQLNFRDCPICNSRKWKLYLHPDTGVWVCFDGEHQAPPGGGYPGGVLAIDQPGIPEAMAAIRARLEGPEPARWEEIELPPFVDLGKVARRYLKQRGITDERAAALGLVQSESDYRILIPYFDASGKLIFYSGRRYSDSLGTGPKYMTAPGKHPLYVLGRWNGGLTRPTGGEIVEGARACVIVEGVFDAIAVWSAGYKAIALGGKSLPKYLEDSLLTEVAGCGILVVLLDSDALSNALRLQARINTLPGRRSVRIVLVPRGEDPSSMKQDSLRTMLDNITK